MIRLTCYETGYAIWIRPEMILCVVPTVDESGSRTRVDIDSVLGVITVIESPDQIALLLGLLVVI